MMVFRTVCAGLAAFSALVAMSAVASADSSDLRPIGICIDGPDTGNFVGRAVWTSCNDAEGTARSKARGFAEGFARNGCGGGRTVAQGIKVCGARGGILIRTTPYLSNTDTYAISISASLGFCSRIQDGLMQPPTFSSAKKCGAQPPSWWHGSWFGNWQETTATTTDKATCGYVCSK